MKLRATLLTVAVALVAVIVVFTIWLPVKEKTVNNVTCQVSHVATQVHKEHYFNQKQVDEFNTAQGNSCAIEQYKLFL